MLLRVLLLGPAHERLQRLGRLGHGHSRHIVIRVEHEARMDCRVPYVLAARRRRREHVAATEFKAKVAPYLVEAPEL